MATEDSYVWTEREQLEELVVCPHCGAHNDRSELYCDGCETMLVEEDWDPNDNFVAERTGEFVGKSPEARSEQNSVFFDKVWWFIRNWIFLLLLSTMTIVLHIGLFGGIIALIWWDMGGVSLYPAVGLFGVAFVTLLLFDLFNRFGVFEWIYCESAF